MLDHLPQNTRRVLDLGTGDGRLIRLIKVNRPDIEAVALDVSPTMLKSARDHFAGDSRVKITEHDLSKPLPDLGYFDAVVSSFAIHHLKHERKRELYEEIYDIINPLILNECLFYLFFMLLQFVRWIFCHATSNESVFCVRYVYAIRESVSMLDSHQ